MEHFLVCCRFDEFLIMSNLRIKKSSIIIDYYSIIIENQKVDLITILLQQTKYNFKKKTKKRFTNASKKLNI